MKVVAFIPVKLNNERFPNKNIIPFDNGEPLIKYILNTITKVENIDEIYVYCSNESIKKYLPKNVKFLKRETYLDKSETSFNEVLTTFADKVDSDIYVLTHVTAPFIEAESIYKGVENVKLGKYDSALSVVAMQEFIWKDKKPFNYNANNIPRTQDLEKMYIETCGLYVYNQDVIKNKKRRIGDKPYLIEISKIEAIDINTKEDFIIANAVYNSIRKDK